jgi:hypothetical protein
MSLVVQYMSLLAPQMNDRRWPLSSPSPGREHEVAPEPAYIHCSWNVNNDQFCPHDRPEACRTKCEGVCVGLCGVGYRVRLSGDRRARAEGVTKRCRLSWLTNSALVYESICGGRGGVAGSQPMSTSVHMVPKKTLEI